MRKDNEKKAPPVERVSYTPLSPTEYKELPPPLQRVANKKKGK